MMNKGTVNKIEKDWFGDFPTPAFLRFSSVDMYISTLFWMWVWCLYQSDAKNADQDKRACTFADSNDNRWGA